LVKRCDGKEVGRREERRIKITEEKGKENFLRTLKLAGLKTTHRWA